MLVWNVFIALFLKIETLIHKSRLTGIFHFRTLKISFHCVLASIVVFEKLGIYLSWFVNYLFSLHAFKISSFLWYFWLCVCVYIHTHTTSTYISLFIFSILDSCFLYLWVHALSSVLGNSQPLVFRYCLSSIFSFSNSR